MPRRPTRGAARSTDRARVVEHRVVDADDLGARPRRRDRVPAAPRRRVRAAGPGTVTRPVAHRRPRADSGGGAGASGRLYGARRVSDSRQTGGADRDNLDAWTNTRYRIIESPVGFITIAGDDDGTITGVRMEDQAHPPAGLEDWEPDDGRVPGASSTSSTRTSRVSSPSSTSRLRLEGTEFQRRVWAGLLEIPYGETISYGELATRIGQPTASRAVGLANGRNPVAIIVPCHRVIGATGSLTGYGGGLDRKRTLLDLERSRREPQLIATTEHRRTG